MSLLRRPETRAANLSAAELIAEHSGRGFRTSAGQVVNRDTAKRLMAVWRCQHMLADIVSGLPIHQYRPDDDGRREVPRSPFVESPSRWVDGFEWRYQLMLSALECGNGVAYVTEFDPGLRFAVKAEVLDPADVTVSQRGGALAPPVYRVAGKEVDSNRILHLRAFGPRPGSVLGMSPIEYARQTIGLGLAVREYGANWYDGGGHPTTLLTNENEVSPDDARIAKERFKESTRGDHVAAVGKGWSVQTLQANPDDALFLNATNATAVDICGYYGIPPELLGYSTGGSAVTYANREQRAIDLLVFTVQWWVGRMERLISRQVPAPEYVKVNVNALLRSDLMTRYRSYDIGVRGGFLRPNEARAWEELARLDTGDETLWPPYRTVPIDSDPEG